MKKILPLLVVSVLVLSGLGAVATHDDEYDLKNIQLDFSRPILKNEDEYYSLILDEANSYIMKPGKPMLPCYTHTLYFEFGTRINSVKCTPENIQKRTITKDIEPTPERAVQGKSVAIKQEDTATSELELYPSTWFEYDVGCGIHDGERKIIVKIQVNPIRYYQKEKTILYARDVDLEIEYELPDTPDPVREEYQLIVIGPDEFSDEIAPFITHKNGRGITSKFVGLTEVYGGTGRDNQEKIKYFIKDAIENWATGNILLVGSSLKLPVRITHVWIQEEYDDGGSVELFVSDLYYADIYNDTGEFASWDSNGNDMFGELDWEGEGNTDTDVDLYPDVYFGRWACVNGAQVTTLVNKVKTYENDEAYKQEWFTHLVACGGDTSPDYDTVEGEYINQIVINLMSGFTHDKLWVTNGVLTGWTPTGVAAIKSAINDGCGFVDFSGHGNPAVWATHPEESHNWVPTPLGHITKSDIGTLSNGDELPIVAVEACSTSKFNADANCFNWAFMANSNGGAIATFGATGLGWGYVGTGISQGLIGKMGLDTFRAYKTDGSGTFGEMWAKALDRYIKPNMEHMDYKTVEEWQPFGDPTLVIGEESNPPAQPSVPDGPPSGKIGTEYIYTTSTTDPDGDDIYYMFDWDDGTTSGWLGPYDSGDTASGKKTWTDQDTYEIRVVARDDHGKLSSWSDTLIVTMPKGKQISFSYPVFSWLLDHFSNAFPLLRYIMG